MPTESRIVIHRPPSIRWRGELPDGVRALLEREVRAAVERGALASLENALGGIATGAEPITPTPSPSELLEVARIRPPGAYALPSYGDEGELQPVPVALPSTNATGDQVLTAASPFEGKLVLILPGGDYVHLGRAERFVEATSFRKAVELGLGIFGTTSFAILQGPITGGDSRYWAVATDVVVSHDLLGRGSEPFKLQFVGTATSYSRSHTLMDFVFDDKDRQYAVTTLVTKERDWLARDVWRAVRLRETLTHPGPGLSRAQRRALVFTDIDSMVRAILGGDDEHLQDAADRLAQLDVEAYVLVDWETKVDYLKVLIRAWTLAEHEKAIVEIMRSLGSIAELKAVQALLATAGLFDQLFNDLDEELWSLLTTVGHRFGDPGPITLPAFIELVEQAFKVPRSLQELIQRTLESGDPLHLGLASLAELHQAVLAVIRFLIGIVDALKLLVTHPLKVIEGIYKLGEMVLMFELAKYGYPKAMNETDRILKGIGHSLVNGFKGMAVLQLGDAVVTRIKWALIVEVASWFIGVGEVKAAIASVGLTGKVTAALRFLGILGKLAEAAEAEVIAARLSRVARAMREASTILREAKGEEEVMKLLSHLPEEDVARLGTLLETVEVAEGATLANLAAHAELVAVARDSMRKAEVLQVLAKKAGGLSEEVGAAFRRLAGSDGFHIDELAGVITTLKDGEGARFLAAMERIGFERIGPGAQVRADFLKLLAGDARRMNAVGDIGFGVVDTMFKRAGGDAAAFDAALKDVTRVQARYASEGKAVEYRKLLDRLERNEPGAWVEIEDIRRVVAGQERLAPFLKSPKATQGIDALLRKGNHAMLNELLDAPDELTALTDLEKVGELTDHQIDGLAAVRNMQSGELGREAVEWSEIFNLEPAHRTELLDLVADVKGSVTEGLDRAVAKGLQGDVTGSLGQFQTVRGLQNRFGAGARFRLEVSKGGAGGIREVDIEMTVGGRTIDVEVKAYAKGTPFKGEVREQMGKDLLAHLNDPGGPWTDMLWRLDPEKAGALPTVQRYMTAELERLFAEGKIPGTLKDAKALLQDRLNASPPWRLIDVIQF